MARIREIVFDCLDAPELARFWAAALDGYSIREYDAAEIERLADIGRAPETDPKVAVDGPGPTLFMQEVDELTSIRNRVHLDLDGGERDEEVARLEELGATIRDEHEAYTVMLDPAGNAFCVVAGDGD
jgi:hypothetical protein